MIRPPRSRRLSLLTLTVLLAGSAAVLAPAAVPATSELASEQAGSAAPRAAAPGLPVASSFPAQQATTPASEVTAEGLTSSLTALAATTPAPDRDQLLTAFVDAGFRGDFVEVSLDRTPTGLGVDSIRGAAINGDTCLFGEVREGQVSVTALPILDSGYCFVGDQR